MAAGMSRRMGNANKLLLSVSGERMVRHVVQVALNASPLEVIVVLGHEAERVENTLTGLPIKCIHHPLYAQGLTSSIQAGVRALSAQSEGLMVVLADQPLLSVAQIQTVMKRFERTEAGAIVVPMREGIPGHPVLFDACYTDEILGLTYPDGCRPLLKAHKNRLISLRMDQDGPFLDVDTPEDYARLKEET